MLTVTDLHVAYGKIEAVRGVSLSAQPGRITLVLGANGAGKSTTLKAIAGIAPPRRGAVRVLNRDLAGRKPHVIARAGMGLDERWRMIEKVHELWEKQKLTLVFIEHDMDVVFKIANTIRVLCYGRVLAEGTPDEIRANPAVIEAYLGAPAEEVDA